MHGSLEDIDPPWSIVKNFVYEFLSLLCDLNGTDTREHALIKMLMIEVERTPVIYFSVMAVITLLVLSFVTFVLISHIYHRLEKQDLNIWKLSNDKKSLEVANADLRNENQSLKSGINVREVHFISIIALLSAQQLHFVQVLKPLQPKRFLSLHLE